MDDNTDFPEPRLVLEEASGTAIIDGVALELPRREFRLLVELAKRPGETLSTDALAEAVWPDAYCDMSQELYVLTSRLRRLIGDDTATSKLVRNRRGFGYWLDVSPAEVAIDGQLVDGSERPVALVAAAATTDEAPPLVSPPGDAAVSSTSTPARPSFARRLATGGIVAAAVAASWSAGFLLSQHRSPAPMIVQAPTDTQTSPARDDDQHQSQQPSRKDLKAKRASPRSALKQPRAIRRRPQRVVSLAAAPLRSAAVSAQTESREAPRHVSERSAATRRSSRPSRPSLPPPPAAYLYHMVNRDTGEHIMTINPNMATSYQKRGYVGSPIGRVYTSPQPNTLRISTDFESAYIFTTAFPETRPSSTTSALWYSTNGSGDSFYTTSQTEANQGEWSATMIGYIRTS